MKMLTRIFSCLAKEKRKKKKKQTSVHAAFKSSNLQHLHWNTHRHSNRCHVANPVDLQITERELNLADQTTTHGAPWQTKTFEAPWILCYKWWWEAREMCLLNFYWDGDEATHHRFREFEAGIYCAIEFSTATMQMSTRKPSPRKRRRRRHNTNNTNKTHSHTATILDDIHPPLQVDGQ